MYPNACNAICRLCTKKFQLIIKIFYSFLIVLIFIKIVYHIAYNRGARSSIHLQQNARNNLVNNIKLFCIIVTDESRGQTVAIHTYRTWAKHCNHVLYVSDNTDVILEPIAIRKTYGEWNYTKTIMQYVRKFHLNEGDWFLKANDDNLVIVENLRYMLSSYSKDKPIIFGCKLRNNNNETFMYGGAGYVLSKEALRRFVDVAQPDPKLCNQNNDGAVDEELAKCLNNIGVEFGDSRDAYGGHTFLPFEAETHLIGLNKTTHDWYYRQAYYPFENNIVPVSRNAISFHIQYAPVIYTNYYLIYNVRRFGSTRKVNSSSEGKMFLPHITQRHP